MNLLRTRYVSVYLFLLFQTVSSRAIFTNMNLTQVPVIQNGSEETYIDLSMNLLSRVEDNAFVLFPRLSKLILAYNQISFLSDLAFNGTSIQRLFVYGNKLTALPRFASIGFSLQQLYAHTNLIEKIGKDEFKGVTRLRFLIIHRNRLTSVHSEAFSDCANTMNWLVFRSNPSLTSIPAEIFTGMGQLDQLDFLDSTLTSFPDFRYLPVNNRLFNLWISSPHLRDLPTNALYKLRNLNDLALKNSLGITRVPDFSRQRGSVKWLTLVGTNIREIPNTAFDNLDLRYLNLSSNKLTRLPNLQSIQSTIKRLDLSGNNFSTVTCEDIQKMIANCPLLTYGVFQKSNIKTFPDILSDDQPVSCNFTPPLLSTTSTSILSPVTPTIDMALTSQDYRDLTRTHLIEDNSSSGVSPAEALRSSILAAALGGSLGVVFFIVVMVVIVFVCRMRSSSSSNTSRDNNEEGDDNDAYLRIRDGSRTYSEPPSHYTELTKPPTNPYPAGVYDEIDDLALDRLAKGAQGKNPAGQAGVVIDGVPVYNNVTTSGATKAVYQNVKKKSLGDDRC